MMRSVAYSSSDSPIGPIHIAKTDKGVCAISIAVSKDDFLSEIKRHGIPKRDDASLEKIRGDLRDYFNGKKVDLHGHKLDISSGTAFQQKVWKKLLEIPYGEIRSYKWLAQEVGSPNGSRAVGGANGKNPIPIIIPCHRVINSDGSLGGYSGGVWIKEWLLRLERAG